MNEKQHSDKLDDFLKESLENYEAPYNSNNWFEMEKKLDLRQRSNWFRKPSSAVKLIAGIIAISITVFLLYRYANDHNEIPGKGKLQNEIPPSQNQNFDDRTIIKSDNVEENDGSGFDQSNIETDNHTDFTEDKTRNENIDNKDAGVRENGQNTEDLVKNEINAQDQFTEGSTDENKPWLDMLRGAYVQNDRDVPEPKAVFFADRNSGCEPLLVKFTSDNTDIPKTYLWNFGDGFYSNEATPVHLYEQNGTYSVTLTVVSMVDRKKETKTVEDMITVYQRPRSEFDWNRNELTGTDKEIHFVDQSEGAIGWEWNFGNGEILTTRNPSTVYQEKGVYQIELIVKNSYGCLDTAVNEISINNKIRNNELYAPNAFSPNGDGINDVFCPKALGITEGEFEMSIHDRNGKLIFETEDINQPWDGKIMNSNRIAPEGTYIYLVIIKDEFGEQRKHVGNISLLRK